MGAIQCWYVNPYRAYPPIFVDQTRAYADFSLDALFDIGDYEINLVEAVIYLGLSFTEFVSSISQINRDFAFVNTGAGPVGPFEIDISAVTNAAEMMAAIAAAIDANTGMIVEYTPGTTTMRLLQPGLGPQGATFPIIWSSFVTGSINDGPVHPSGMTVTGSYAPRPVDLPGTLATGIMGVPSAEGFDSTELVDGILVFPYYTGTGISPWTSTQVHFVSAAGPVIPNVAYCVLDGTETEEETTTLLAAAVAELGFNVTPLTANTFSITQDFYGPGGNSFVAVAGTAVDIDWIDWNGLNVSNTNAFANGTGSNIFGYRQGVYGGNTIPLRFGKNYAMLPPLVVPLIET